MNRGPIPRKLFARALRRSETDAEYRLWYELKGRRLNGYKFVRQYPVGSYVADFACRSHALIIELDGGQHAERRRNEVRTAWLNRQGWSVLRFWNDEVIREIDGVLETILAAVDGRLSKECEGAKLFRGLRFAPVAPSSASGRGEASLPDRMMAGDVP